MTAMAQVREAIELPGDIRSSAVKFSEGEYLHELVREHGFTRTLETGLGLGLSAASILSASCGGHVAIDPFQANYGNCGLRNLERLGLRDRLDFHADYSHAVLPRLLAEGRRFQLAFIDGDHRFDGQFVDFYYAALLIEEGGYIVLHDTWMRGTAYLASYVRANRGDFVQVRSRLQNLAVFRRRGADERDWMHFEGFRGSARAFVAHHVIRAIHVAPDSLFSRTALRMKELLK